MRVLHVIDPGSPGGGACTLQLLSEPLTRLSSVKQDVLIIGTERHETLALRCGVEPTGRLSPPVNEPLLAGFRGDAFKRFLRTYEHHQGAYDIIHTWTARSALLAAVSASAHKRVGTLAVGPVNGLLMQVLAKRMEFRPAWLLATNVAVKRDYMAMGLLEEHIEVLSPAVHPEAVQSQSRTRASVRAEWRVEDDAFVVGLLAEPMSWADARRAAGVVALMNEAGRDVRLVVHPAAQRRMEAIRWLERLGQGHVIILEDELTEPWRCVHGLDAALFIGDDSTTLDLRDSGSPLSLLTGGGRQIRPMTGIMPALWAMGYGVPVVAEASMAMQEIIDDSANGFLFKQRDINGAAQCLTRLIDDRAMAGRISAAAREDVHDDYHVSAYCVRLKEFYERVMEGRLARIVGEGGDVIEQRANIRHRR